ncbi:MAG: DNA replication/repair protein RecF [Gordonia sp. (in: high G+C Gram-positive bacteria)]|uniref:DNA replication/repair protein RecF n=1 Tax=Gordonia sp. (in: high G+C Gram-positive bacteria) TaxID=84139 RepID=UPI003BB5A4F4
MFVRELALTDYRSWDRLSLELGPEPTILVGRNGFGKTNVLEALFYIATLRSHRVATDAPLVRSGAEVARIVTTVHNSGRELSVDLTIAAQGANKAAINTSPVRRPREVLGILRAVLFAPEDLALVRGDPGERRRFLDEIVVQLRPIAAGAKADYEKVLRQRSALLKTAGSAIRRSAAEADSVMSTLDVWDAQLAQFGAEVTAERLAVVRELNPLVSQTYSYIAPHSRTARIQYRSAAGPEVDACSGGPETVPEIREMLARRLVDVRAKEIDRGLCLIGPHRDDLLLTLGSEPAKGFASHGESWSLALALRLACVDLLRVDGVEPVIMLDDVFAELDTARREKLAEFTSSAEQLLITAAVGADIPAAAAGRRIFVGVNEENGIRRSVILEDRTVGDQQVHRTPAEEESAL